ncbi:hypothetical protein GGR43_004573 [Sphingobium jiangsuense]|uniref:Uncharacterized protein n=1 Tax=Sphingobium jiangsuense TaxID=870476 RepID=A0A7W6FSA3_9SPHN|nr:hypothetical protein [Sphingobium jiangsuense]MBB3928828.1 hypothetical protein [Sphingobium jiangsuense]
MRNHARRLALLEADHAARNPEPRRELTHKEWVTVAQWRAATIAYWLGDSANDPWARLYSGINAGNASSDRASAIRHPLCDRFDWAADMEAGKAATGVVNTHWLQAWKMIPETERKNLSAAFPDLEERHPELIGPKGGYGPYYRVTMEGQLIGCDDGAILADIPLAAFGIEAGVAALKRQEIELT